MAIRSIEHIDLIYTEILKGYLNKGYQIYSKTMRGCQGSQAPIHITNGKLILQLRIDHFSFREIEGKKIYMDGIRIIVEEYTDFHAGTLWNNKGNLIDEKIFYQVGRRRYGYTDDLEEAETALNKSYSRYKLKHSEKGKSLKFNPDILIKIVNNHKGFRGCRKKDIEALLKYEDMFYIRINGRASNSGVAIRFPNKLIRY